MPNQHQPQDGLSLRELILELRDEVCKLRDDLRGEIKRLDDAVNRRPTRSEVVSWVTTIAVVIGVVVAVS